MPHHAELPPEENIAEHPSPANDPNVINLHDPALEFEPESAPARTPLRFGRLALWMASASALGIGVLGTVAYSMWFNHDQRVYAEAMASARRTLGIDQPAIAAQTQSAGVVEAPTTVPPGASPYVSGDGPAPIATTALADNPPPPDASDESTLADTSDSGDSGTTAATTSIGAAALATAAAASTQAAQGTQAAPPAQNAAAQRRGNPSATQQTAAYRANAAAQARRRPAHAAKPESGGLFARMGAFFHRVSYKHNVPNRQREEYSRP